MFSIALPYGDQNFSVATKRGMSYVFESPQWGLSKTYDKLSRAFKNVWHAPLPWQPKIFNHLRIMAISWMAIKFFQLPSDTLPTIGRRLKIFGCWKGCEHVLSFWKNTPCFLFWVIEKF
jgi:hypothetical protein